MGVGWESDRAPGPPPKGGCLRAPGMPLFEPSHDQAASDVLRMAAEKAQIGDGQQYHFPADVQFWDNFLAQMGLHAGARTPPLFVVCASHDPNQYHVNRQWMNGFVRAWEEQNPHVVTVTGPTGITNFYASEEFWNMLENQLPDDGGGQAAGAEYVVKSSVFPSRALRTTPDQWKKVVDNWEITKKCTAADRNKQLEERRAEAEEKREMLDAECQVLEADDVPIPFMFLSPEMIQEDPLGTSTSGLFDDADDEFDFQADVNFWRNLRRLAHRVEQDPPVYDVVSDRGERARVGRSFLRRFVAAWQREFPLIITTLMSAAGQPRSIAFNATPEIWREVEYLAVGRATREEEEHPPPGLCLIRSSHEDPSSPCLKVPLPAYLDLCAKWGDVSPTVSGWSSRGIGSDYSAASSGRPRRAHAPCVRLPKPGETRETPKPKKKSSRHDIGAVPRRERTSVPTVQLHLHQGILDGLAARPRRNPRTVPRWSGAEAGQGTGSSLGGYSGY
eukprot:Hpha_TRINITY_DN16207_c0_g6::TRINITY_DN16207_c0_g6_i1::g.16428::m.16428